MKPREIPRFGFSRSGKTVFCSVSPGLTQNQNNVIQDFHFSRTCESEVEAILLLDYLSEFQWHRDKHIFTEGFEAHKKREKNYYL